MMNFCNTRDRLRMALGGMIAGGFLGALIGAFVGCILGIYFGRLGMGLDGALIGAGSLACIGALISFAVPGGTGEHGTLQEEEAAATHWLGPAQRHAALGRQGPGGKTL